MNDKHPTMWWSTSSRVGGCSCCNRHGTPSGEANHRVLVIQGAGGTMTRICALCRRNVLKLKPPPKTATTR